MYFSCWTPCGRRTRFEFDSPAEVDHEAREHQELEHLESAHEDIARPEMQHDELGQDAVHHAARGINAASQSSRSKLTAKCNNARHRSEPFELFQSHSSCLRKSCIRGPMGEAYSINLKERRTRRSLSSRRICQKPPAPQHRLSRCLVSNATTQVIAAGGGGGYGGGHIH